MHYVSEITFIGMCWNGIIKTLINFVQKFIVRSFWNNAAVQIRQSNCAIFLDSSVVVLDHKDSSDLSNAS